MIHDGIVAWMNERSIDATSLVVSHLKPPWMTSAAPNLESDRSWAGPRNIEVGRASQGMSAFPWCWLRLDSILIPNLQSEINWDQLLSVEITFTSKFMRELDMFVQGQFPLPHKNL